MSDDAPVVRVGDPGGSYRRRIRTTTVENGVVEGGLEDDFHHFEVTLRHDGERVTGIEARSRRWPWATCPDAASQLPPIVGMPLSLRCTAIAAVADPRMNCTHQFDLAGLCVSHAARRLGRRQYDAELPPAVDGMTAPRLWRDGELVLAWTLSWRDGRPRLGDCPPYDRAPWRGGFFRWADETFDPETAEAAIVLRRACEIGMSEVERPHRVRLAERPEPDQLGESTQSVDRLGRATPRRHEESSHTQLFPALHVVVFLDRSAQADLERRVVAPVLAS